MFNNHQARYIWSQSFKSIWNSPEMCPSWRQFREQSTTSLSSLMPPWLPWWKPTFSHQKLRLLDYQMHAFQAAFRLGWWLSAWELSTLQAFCSWLGATGSRRWSRICGSWRIEDMRRLGRSDFISVNRHWCKISGWSRTWAMVMRRGDKQWLKISCMCSVHKWGRT